MDLGIAGKVALVTAASKGLGLAAARALSEEGARVVMCARDPDTLARAAATLPGEVLAVPADVTEPAAPGALVAAALERFGGLDILVANAGGPPQARALDVTDEQISQAVNANLVTSVRLVRESLPHMRAAGWGRICLITSISVKQPIPDLALSNLARTGLWAWAKTAAADVFASGVTLNLVCPGLHATDRVLQLGSPRDRLGEPADFGRVVAFLCSAPAAFISGSAVSVDGAASSGLL
ncbi:MAG TPA: SDR family oxidoreductase [Acidimicrobiales bacterium]|nr:SDR family oxidoreductase [Acidimicrobiales bacterium]